MKKYLFFIFLIFIFARVDADGKKVLEAQKITKPPKIDGIIEQEFWGNIPVGSNFIQEDPHNGMPSIFRSEVQFAYDNSAIYIAARLYDPNPDSILQQLSLRDDIDNINADIFKVVISPFNDGLNGFEYGVSVAGVQGDKMMIGTSTDKNWDAVWVSRTKITSEGWVVEMKIPFSSIRFPNKKEQVWGINFYRHIRRYREWSSFNFVNKEINGTLNQAAQLVGIHDIVPPPRLAFFPYVSGYGESHPDENDPTYRFNYGMDLKYGINESFTLDMTLIPDFGQVQSDDQVLNLSPYEVRYSERRQFFTEGTELFNRGGLFYSRRVGSTPVNYYSAGENEEILENPAQTKLINAFKVSGRNHKKLGIGVFNAITEKTQAVYLDSNDTKQSLTTQPFTNYNIVVFDQSLKNNSYLSFINTNMSFKDYSANVSGLVFNFFDKKNTYSMSGKAVVNQKYYKSAKNDFGHSYNINIGKRSGNFLFNLYHVVETDNYDINDMGYLQANNDFNFGGSIEYNIYVPFWKVLSWYNSFEVNHGGFYNPRVFSYFNMELSTRTTFPNFLSVGMNVSGSPVKGHDYFETRVQGRKFKTPEYINFDFWLSPDYRKMLAVDLNGSIAKFNRNGQLHYSFRVKPRFRPNDKLFIIYQTQYTKKLNNAGYVNDSLFNGNPVITFGNREQTTIENLLNLSYIFNNRTSLSFRLRHYWSQADYDQYYNLEQSGFLTPSDYQMNGDVHFNSLNIDMVYTFYFAPGSEMTIGWKNIIAQRGDETLYNYIDILNSTFETRAFNSISIKILYYLDYMYFKRKEV